MNYGILKNNKNILFTDINNNTTSKILISTGVIFLIKNILYE